jgi:tetratricopeptide (TPR) repeat protein
MQSDDLAYFDSEEFRTILNQYEESVESEHPVYIDADDLADIADYYQYNGFPEKARAAVNLALEYNPEAVGPLLFKAREAIMANDFDTAEEYAEKIEAVDTAEAIYLKGEIMISQGKTEEADQYFIDQMKEVMQDELMDYVYDVANIFSDYNLHDKAFQWMARSQGDDSDSFKELMAHTLFGLGKYKDSERIFNELIDHDPYSIRYWNALASAQFMREDYSAAITSSEYAIAIDPKDPESLLSKANCLYNLQNYEEALDYFQRYSEQADEDEFGYLYQGTCLINLGRYQEAVSLLKKALDTAPPDSQYLPEIYQELAFGYSELGKTENALHYLDQTQSLDCDHANMEIIKGHILLANKQPEEASEAFRVALKLSDNSPRTMLRIIVSLYDNQYTQTSYTFLKHLFAEMDEDWNEGFSYMALCCRDLGKEKEFLHYLRLASEKNPKEAKTVLSGLFPAGLDPKEYYHYILNRLNKT